MADVEDPWSWKLKKAGWNGIQDLSFFEKMLNWAFKKNKCAWFSEANCKSCKIKKERYEWVDLTHVKLPFRAKDGAQTYSPLVDPGYTLPSSTVDGPMYSQF